MKDKKFLLKVRPPVLLRPEPAEIVARSAHWFGVRSGEMYGLAAAVGLDPLKAKWKPFVNRHQPDSKSFARMKAESEPWTIGADVNEEVVRPEVILRSSDTAMRLHLWWKVSGVLAPEVWGAVFDVGAPYLDEILRELNPGYAAWVDAGAAEQATPGFVTQIWERVFEIDNRRVLDRRAEEQGAGASS